MSEHNENINKIQFRLPVTYRQLSAVINQITSNLSARKTFSRIQAKINSTTLPQPAHGHSQRISTVCYSHFVIVLPLSHNTNLYPPKYFKKQRKFMTI